MCCNYCYHFTECKKGKKSKSDCCENCAEYEYCPFILDAKVDKDSDFVSESESDLDLLEGEEF